MHFIDPYGCWSDVAWRSTIIIRFHVSGAGFFCHDGRWTPLTNNCRGSSKSRQTSASVYFVTCRIARPDYGSFRRPPRGGGTGGRWFLPFFLQMYARNADDEILHRVGAVTWQCAQWQTIVTLLMLRRDSCDAQNPQNCSQTVLSFNVYSKLLSSRAVSSKRHSDDASRTVPSLVNE